MASKTSALESLYKILQQEKASGYLDSAVIGGLDGFLDRRSDEIRPVLGDLGSYSLLTPAQRGKWADTVIATLPEGALSGARKASVRRTSSRAAASPQRGARVKQVPDLPLDASVERLKGVSTHNLRKLKRLNVETVKDLVYHFPHRHNDFGKMRKVSELELGQDQTVAVTAREATETRQGPRKRSTQAVLGDDTGNIRAIWFNNPYMVRTLRPGTSVVISGRVNMFRGQLVFESPEYEVLQGQEELMHTGRLVPVYPTVDGLYQRILRRLVKQALEIGITKLVDFLPEEVRHRTGLVPLQPAVSQAHYPDSAPDWNAARRRLAFDELFLMQVAALARKRAWQGEASGIPLKADTALIDGFLSSLPFDLTDAQDRGLREILGDLSRDRPMNRLLQGDVGSGKTVVAAAALLAAVFNRYQGALMVPTEILAEQHFLTVSRLMSGASEGAIGENVLTVRISPFPEPVTIGLLLGSLTKRAKDEVQRRVAEGEIDIVIGTHALIQSGVEIPRLALAVVDEQHRFGVMQRSSLREKSRRPHVLAMSATPIPRSLALTVYGDLDISVIDELPAGRQRIRTRWVEPERRVAAYNFVRKEVESGRQVFIVCPLIEESEVVQARAASEEHERLSTQVFPDLRLGLLHGRMKLRDKEIVMGRFQSGELDIMVSTTVVEVGIDVPNATVMLIDGADRFGLAQLHQLRGRVGRGVHQSHCLLLSDALGEDARRRLKIMERVHDGFQLAEEDLSIRGPGDYMGTRQSGLPDLKVARLSDHDILSLARREATRLLDLDPGFARPENARLAEEVRIYSAGFTEDMS